MKTSTTRLFITAVLLLVFTAPANSQITKGDYLIDFSSSINYSDAGANRPTGGFSATYMRMLKNNIMIGGSLAYSFSYNTAITSGRAEYYPFNSYTLSPTIRYYFANGILAPFASIENNFYVQDFSREGRYSNFSGYQTIAGLGFNYFLGGNIAIETLVTSNLVTLGDYKEDGKYISFNTGLRLFINSKLSNHIDSLPSRVLRKGNITTSTNFSFNHRFGDRSTGQFHLSPNLRYFVTDRLNVYGSYRYTFYKFPTNNQHIMSAGVGIGYYIGLTDYLFLNMGIGAELEFEDGIFKELFSNSYRRLNLPVSSSLVYFVDQKRFHLGLKYEYAGLKILGNDLKYYQNNFTLVGGLDYFVLNNVFIKGDLNYYITGDRIRRGNPSTEISSGFQHLRLAFGIGFIIDARR